MELEKDKKTINGFGIASIIIGILGLLLICINCKIALILVIIGIILGICGIVVLENANKGLAIAGIIVNGVACGISVIILIIAIEKNGIYSIVGIDNYKMKTFDDVCDVTEIDGYEGSTGGVLILKYVGKENATVKSSLFVYDKNGNVIDKADETIHVVKGYEGCCFYFLDVDFEEGYDSNISETISKPNWSSDDVDGVEMIKWNAEGHKMYITVRQKINNINSGAKYKLLYYSKGVLVDLDEGCFSSDARNLNGINSTDVIEKICYKGSEIDKVVFYYEP